jgi:ubiquinone/menaquinone biosynthesis C-methylase UbiE
METPSGGEKSMFVRQVFRVLVAFSAGSAVAVAQAPDPHKAERQDIVIADLAETGYILDIGGGCRGTIGRLKPKQVVAIDISPRELKEAPADFLKIVMDATDLKFLDGTFGTVTAFYSLMYMKPDVQEKVFAEAWRVLKPDGKWLIWDSVIQAASPGSKGERFDAYLRTHLPSETIEYGYSINRPDRSLDVSYYSSLAVRTGFEVTDVKEQGAGKSFLMTLRKP